MTNVTLRGGGRNISLSLFFLPNKGFAKFNSLLQLYRQPPLWGLLHCSAVQCSDREDSEPPLEKFLVRYYARSPNSVVYLEDDVCGCAMLHFMFYRHSITTTIALAFVL